MFSTLSIRHAVPHMHTLGLAEALLKCTHWCLHGMGLSLYTRAATHWCASYLSWGPSQDKAQVQAKLAQMQIHVKELESTEEMQQRKIMALEEECGRLQVCDALGGWWWAWVVCMGDLLVSLCATRANDAVPQSGCRFLRDCLDSARPPFLFFCTL